jgi:nitroreductase
VGEIGGLTVEFADVVARRRMTRSFDPDRPVPPAALDAVLSAACRAPSAGFTQAVSFLVLVADDATAYWIAATNATDLAAPDRWLRGLQAAPVLIAVWTDEDAYLDRYAEPDKGWTDRDPARWSAPYWWVDAGMGVLAALLAATDQGLGTCFFGVPPERIAAVRHRFEVPDEQASVGVLALGYPAPGSTSRPKRARRSRDVLIHVGRWTG